MAVPFLHTLKMILLGLLVAVVGAIVGTTVAALFGLGFQAFYVALFDTTDLQRREMVATEFIFTFISGPLLGAVASVAAVARWRTWRRSTAALLCLAGGLPVLVCSGAGMVLEAISLYTIDMRWPTAYAIPLPAACVLVYWGIKQLTNRDERDV